MGAMLFRSQGPTRTWHFDGAIALAPPEFAEILRNARDHPRSSIEYTVRAFGPADW